MAGKIGRSGRRSLSVEVERSKIRDAAWKVTGEYLDSNAPLEKRVISAVKIVQSDMAKPAEVNIDNSTHHHLTIDLSKMSKQERLDFVLGRNNGRSDIRQPA